MSAFTDKVVQQCLTEFARFKNGTGRAIEEPFAGFVGEYWRIGLKINNIDGRTTFQDSKGNPPRPPWSTAFISLIMRKSRAGDAFFYHEGNIHSVVKAIRDAKAGSTTAKFLGRDPLTYVPKAGDLITAGRGAEKGMTFTTVLSKYGNKQVPMGNFLLSHTDIVIDIDADKKRLTTMGGNVDDTVAKKTWDLKADGTLVKGKSLICVIECLL